MAQLTNLSSFLYSEGVWAQFWRWAVRCFSFLSLVTDLLICWGTNELYCFPGSLPLFECATKLLKSSLQYLDVWHLWVPQKGPCSSQETHWGHVCSCQFFDPASPSLHTYTHTGPVWQCQQLSTLSLVSDARPTAPVAGTLAGLTQERGFPAFIL